MGELKILEHEITLNRAFLYKNIAYRIHYSLRDTMRKHLSELKKIRKKSNCLFSWPEILINKKNRRIRFVVDYRKLNEVTDKASCPQPIIAECLSQIEDSRIFSLIDLKSG